MVEGDAGILIGAAIGGVAGGLIGNYMDKQAAEIQRDIAGAKVERIKVLATIEQQRVDTLAYLKNETYIVLGKFGSFRESHQCRQTVFRDEAFDS